MDDGGTGSIQKQRSDREATVFDRRNNAIYFLFRSISWSLITLSLSSDQPVAIQSLDHRSDWPFYIVPLSQSTVALIGTLFVVLCTSRRRRFFWVILVALVGLFVVQQRTIQFFVGQTDCPKRFSPNFILDFCNNYCKMYILNKITDDSNL